MGNVLCVPSRNKDVDSAESVPGRRRGVRHWISHRLLGRRSNAVAPLPAQDEDGCISSGTDKSDVDSSTDVVVYSEDASSTTPSASCSLESITSVEVKEITMADVVAPSYMTLATSSAVTIATSTAIQMATTSAPHTMAQLLNTSSAVTISLPGSLPAASVPSPSVAQDTHLPNAITTCTHVHTTCVATAALAASFSKSFHSPTIASSSTMTNLSAAHRPTMASSKMSTISTAYSAAIASSSTMSTATATNSATMTYYSSTMSTTSATNSATMAFSSMMSTATAANSATMASSSTMSTATATDLATTASSSTMSTATATDLATIASSSTMPTATATNSATMASSSTMSTATATDLATMASSSTMSTATATDLATMASSSMMSTATATDLATMASSSTMSTATATDLATMASSTMSTATATELATMASSSTMPTATIASSSTMSTATATNSATMASSTMPTATATNLATMASSSTMSTATATNSATMASSSTMSTATATNSATMTSSSTMPTATATDLATMASSSMMSTATATNSATMASSSTMSTATATDLATTASSSTMSEATATDLATMASSSTMSTATATDLATIASSSTMPTLSKHPPDLLTTSSPKAICIVPSATGSTTKIEETCQVKFTDPGTIATNAESSGEKGTTTKKVEPAEEITCIVNNGHITESRPVLETYPHESTASTQAPNISATKEAPLEAENQKVYDEESKFRKDKTDNELGHTYIDDIDEPEEDEGKTTTHEEIVETRKDTDKLANSKEELDDSVKAQEEPPKEIPFNPKSLENLLVAISKINRKYSRSSTTDNCVAGAESDYTTIPNDHDKVKETVKQAEANKTTDDMKEAITGDRPVKASSSSKSNDVFTLTHAKKLAAVESLRKEAAQRNSKSKIFYKRSSQQISSIRYGKGSSRGGRKCTKRKLGNFKGPKQPHSKPPPTTLYRKPHINKISDVAKAEANENITWIQTETQSLDGQQFWSMRAPMFEPPVQTLGEGLLARYGSVDRMKRCSVVPQCRQIETLKLEHSVYPGLRVKPDMRGCYNIDIGNKKHAQSRAQGFDKPRTKTRSQGPGLAMPKQPTRDGGRLNRWSKYIDLSKIDDHTNPDASNRE